MHPCVEKMSTFTTPPSFSTFFYKKAFFYFFTKAPLFYFLPTGLPPQKLGPQGPNRYIKVNKSRLLCRLYRKAQKALRTALKDT